MENDLPQNVVSLEVLRINRNIDKRCKCEKPNYVVDSRNREVCCSKCGSRIDPFDALYSLAMDWERVEEDTKRLLEQRKQIAKYKPHMIVFRNLEKNYRGKEMLPSCPHCSRGFYFEELTSWTNAELEKRRREKQGEGALR
jgi:hypothetical protein